MRKRWQRRALVLLSVGGLVLAPGCAVFHSTASDDYQRALDASPYDVIIVPGFPAEEDGTWNRVIKARLYWAKRLLDDGIAHHVIFSGSAVQTPYIEGRLMAIYAEAIGVPPASILVETAAEHSCENLYNSYQLARQRGFEKIAVVSDPVQTVKLREFAEEFALPVAFLPADIWLLMGMDKENPTIDPAPAFVEGFQPLGERLSREEIKRNSAGARVREALAQGSGPAGSP